MRPLVPKLVLGLVFLCHCSRHVANHHRIPEACWRYCHARDHAKQAMHHAKDGAHTDNIGHRAQDPKLRHELDRRAVRELICAMCNTRQAKIDQCRVCGVAFGAFLVTMVACVKSIWFAPAHQPFMNMWHVLPGCTVNEDIGLRPCRRVHVSRVRVLR